jgi:cell division cycle 14
VQDILYGVHRAMTENLLDLMTFDLDEYETYEQVQNGDWNWITPNIIAFASPNDRDYVAELRKEPLLNGKSTPALRRPLNASFTKTIQYFKDKNIKLVVRLNNPLYDSKVFEREGIEHVDMYFDDGSNPSEEILREFIKRANEVISAGGAIAVHCKAGLGRTGVLIGAYLAYRHGFTASESIGFMRIMRPGCVVGPQQHFMYKEACNWMRWREQDDAKRELLQALAKQKLELVGTRRRKSDEIEGSSSNDTDLEVDVGLGEATNSHGRQFKKIKMGVQAPHTPKKAKVEGGEEGEEGQAMVTTLVKPTPCVGQPRKSPSPSRKRAAQAQAPATIARMGGLGGGRIMSSGQHRSFSGSSFTRNLQRISQAQESQENQGLEQQESPSTPRGSRVLGEAQRINVQVTADEGEVAMATPRGGDWNAAVKTSSTKSGSTKTNSGVSDSIEDGLFVQGWKSPEPPTVYMDRMASSPNRPNTAVLPAAPSTPTSPSTMATGVRASPHVREKFGLREAGSHQGTPRSRKEAGVADLPPSLSNGSSNSTTSCSSLTSQDAPGSEEETLCAGPLKIVNKTTSPVHVIGPSSVKPSTGVKQAARPLIVTTNRLTSRERPIAKMSAVKSRTASNTSATSSRTASASGTGPTRVISNGNRPATTAVRKVAGDGVGRVAAVKDQLAQKTATPPVSSDLSTRPSLKRLRTQSPVMGSISDAKAAAPAAPSTRTLVPSHIASKFGLGVSSIGVAPVPAPKQVANAVVPRFAAATAASVAKSQHAAAVENISRFQRSGPQYTATTKTVITGPTPGVPPLSIARLNGRNVRRRRSSIS